MSTIIVYKVAEVENGQRISVVKGPDQVIDVRVDYSMNLLPDTVEGRPDRMLLLFKDKITELLPHENAMIFVTEEQSKMMEIYVEKEKHGHE